MGEKDRMVKAMNEASGFSGIDRKVSQVRLVDVKPNLCADCLKRQGLEGELRKMLPLLELNRSTTGVAKRLKQLLGDA